MILATASAIIAGGGGFVWGALMMRRHIFPFWVLRKLLKGAPDSRPARQVRVDFFANHSRKADIVFIGDSLFAGIEWQDIFPDLAIVNRSIGGETASDILARLSSTMATNAPIGILLAGANDALCGVSPDETVRSIEAIYSAYPGKLYVLPVPPCGVGQPEARKARIDEINRRISSLPGFVDIPLFGPEDTVDGTHPNTPGTEKLISAVRALVADLVDSQAAA